MKSSPHQRTRHFNIMLVLLAIAGLVAVWVAIDPLARASQGSRHDWSGHHGAQHASLAFCSYDARDWADSSGAYLGAWLQLDAAQNAAWNHVEQKLEQGRNLLRDACEALAASGPAATMPERLALMESAMAAGAETLRTVRPAFDEFYATLDEGQRQQLDALPGHHRSEIR